MYSEEQLRAIRHGDGPMLVLAGPGSGKTAVIAERVRYLTQRLKVSDEQILVITFTRAAACEMQSRYQKIAGDSQVHFSTIHSLSFQILRQSAAISPSQIVTESERLRMLSQVLLTFQLQHIFTVQDFSSMVSRYKCAGADRSDVIDAFTKTRLKEEFDLEITELFNGYQRLLWMEDKLDLDDLSIAAARLLQNDPIAHALWVKRYTHILIDEFQDVSNAQFALMRLLIHPARHNVFAVGDDDQSIYSFRGADPTVMHMFLNVFPRAQRITLGRNYRCGSEIVRKSSKLIAHNRSRFAKHLVSHADIHANVSVICCETPRQEVLYIVESLQSTPTDKIKPSAAILTRNRASLRFYESALRQAGIGQQRVALATFHGAKGLEFDTVYLPELIEGICPWMNGTQIENLEEERRMLYVAMTRAKSSLHILFPKKHRTKNTHPSRFLREMGVDQRHIVNYMSSSSTSSSNSCSSSHSSKASSTSSASSSSTMLSRTGSSFSSSE